MKKKSLIISNNAYNSWLTTINILKLCITTKKILIKSLLNKASNIEVTLELIKNLDFNDNTSSIVI